MRPVPIVLSALLAAPALAACNQVYSRTPLIAERRQGGDPEFRPGLWLVDTALPDDACPGFDIKKRQRDWPDCAVAVEFRRGQMWLVSSHRRVLAQTQRLAPGEPILVQAHWTTDIFSDPRAPEPRNAENPFFGWTYAWVEPERTDPNGRMIQARYVIAGCGPPHPVRRQGGRFVTEPPAELFPGLARAGLNCTAKDLDTVKAALAASAAADGWRSMRWVRDDP